jgi:restriction endonuclease S subunit
MGRPSGIPAEWVVERQEDGTYTGHPADEVASRAERVQRREKKSEERESELRTAIRAILTKGESPLTRKDIWEALPEELRVNEPRFREVLEGGVGDVWGKEKADGRGGGFVYTANLEVCS